MSSLFSPLKIRNVTFKNRFICSSLHLAHCDKNGVPTQKAKNFFNDLAKGQCGLIIPGCASHLQIKGMKSQIMIANDDQADAWKNTIKSLHSFGSRIFFQISFANAIGKQKFHTKINEFSSKEIDASIDAMIQFARRAKRIKADGIQIHCAHGTPLNSFLSPLANKRNDKYGGSVENRSRILVEITSELQKEADDNFLISLKVNGDDCLPKGSTADDAAKLVSFLPRVDLVEVSCGYGSMALYSRSHYNEKNILKVLPENLQKNLKRTVSQARKEFPLFEGYNLGFAETIKKLNPHVNVSAVGGFKTLKTMEEALKKVDFISLGRPFLRQPDLVATLQSGANSEVDCVRCDQCHLFRDYDPPGRCFLKENFLTKFKK